MKKALLTIFAAVALFAMALGFAACGNAGETPPPDDTQKEQPGDETQTEQAITGVTFREKTVT